MRNNPLRTSSLKFTDTSSEVESSLRHFRPPRKAILGSQLEPRKPYGRVCTCRYFQTYPPTRSLPLPPLHRCLSRPHQRGLRQAATVGATPLQRRSLWPRGGVVFRGVFSVPGAQQHDLAEDRGAALDCSPHGGLGRDLRLDDAGHYATQLLYSSLPVGPGRSRVLPRSDSLPPQLVPRKRPRPHGGPVHDGWTALRCYRGAGLRGTPYAGSPWRPRGLAMAVPAGGSAGSSPGRCCLLPSRRSSQQRELVVRR